MSYLLAIPITVPAILFMALLLLLVDIYPSVKSFRSMFSTESFILLWIMSFLLTLVAYFFLMHTSLTKVQNLVGPEGTKLTVIMLASLMQLTILQSLSLKISDVKILNLQALLDNYRSQVLTDIQKKNSQRELRYGFSLADKLSEKFRGNPERIIEEYSQLLLLQPGQTEESVGKIVAAIEQNAKTLNSSKARLVAGKIVVLDQLRAKQLLKLPLSRN